MNLGDHPFEIDVEDRIEELSMINLIKIIKM